MSREFWCLDSIPEALLQQQSAVVFGCTHDGQTDEESFTAKQWHKAGHHSGLPRRGGELVGCAN